ncbi:hypothetical protein KP509_04G018500 [Ceratopteris richardii]|uniref:Zinc finger protein 830 n=1 Tax=Ceratopteris richardii TaxID=49495 RepID=A0A8T2UUU1_CERRI|nr:hypothetical protein KP509_04G018500 [Ceratopteris richardii]
MDQSKNKAFLKSRMREAAQKREKRIESPLVRYNELGQPVCKVCNIAVKSEALWPAHLASRSHKEAADRLKAQAKGTMNVAGSQTNHTPTVKSTSHVPSALPDDFWDQPKSKDAATKSSPVVFSTEVGGDKDSKVLVADDVQSKRVSKLGKLSEPIEALEPIRVSSEDEIHSKQLKEEIASSRKGAQSSLPEGFFDSVEADYRARGLEPPKFNIQDEWKEFEKSIRVDIREVDSRMEEEEFDAAEEREELESLEQRELLDRLERLKRKDPERIEVTELTDVISKVASKKPFMNVNLSMDEDSNSDGDSEEENALLDWRAKQF